jgi:hypothetical protein
MKDISASILAIVVGQLFLESILIYFGDPGEGMTLFPHTYKKTLF